jgi:sulfur carrier protein
MMIRVNDQPREVDATHALADLLRDLGLADRKGVAVAVNDEVVPRATWATRALAASDHVLVIQATQGG